MTNAAIRRFPMTGHWCRSGTKPRTTPTTVRALCALARKEGLPVEFKDPEGKVWAASVRTSKGRIFKKKFLVYRLWSTVENGGPTSYGMEFLEAK